MGVQMTVERRKAYVEILEVLKSMDQRFVEKIPQSLIEFFDKNKSEEYNYIYDDKKTLNEQDLSNITLNLLAMLNLNYWCEDEGHKKELLELYAENEKKYQEELRKRYNPDNIFKKQQEKSNIEENVIQNEVALIEYKESIFRRLINKIKSIFHMN